MLDRAEHHGKRQAIVVGPSATDDGSFEAATSAHTQPLATNTDPIATTTAPPKGAPSYWSSLTSFLSFKREITPITSIAATSLAPAIDTSASTRAESETAVDAKPITPSTDDSSDSGSGTMSATTTTTSNGKSLAAYQSVLQQMENCLVWIMQPVLHGVPGVADSIMVERERFLALSHNDSERAVAAVLADTRSFATRITEVSFSMAFGMPAAILTPIWRNLRAVALVASLYGHDVESEQVQAEIMWCLAEGEAGRVPRVALRKVVRKVVKHLVRRTLSRAGAKIVGSVLPVGLVYELCIDTSAATHIYERAIQHFRPKDDTDTTSVDATPAETDENVSRHSSRRSSKQSLLRESRSIGALSPARTNATSNNNVVSPLPPRGAAVWSLPEMSASMWLAYSFPSPGVSSSSSSSSSTPCKPRSTIESSSSSPRRTTASPSTPLGSRVRRSTTSSIGSSLSLAKP